MPVTEKADNGLKFKSLLVDILIKSLEPTKLIKKTDDNETHNGKMGNGNGTNGKSFGDDYINRQSSFGILSFNNPKYYIPRFHSPYLRENSKFTGLQQSSKAKYKIEVEFKQVDLLNSLVIGFLKINGLTPEYSEIATCFKGEIINNPLKSLKQNPLNTGYSFLTENGLWGSTMTNDLDHWKRLTNYFNLTDEELCDKLSEINDNERDQGLIYMRWKEEFLLPDARIKQINGASFEGFYYIVLNIGNTNKPELPIGSINGLYYYHSSEKFQSLSLSSISDRGICEVFDFL